MKQENRRKNAKKPPIPSFGAQFLRFYHKNKNEEQTFRSAPLSSVRNGYLPIRADPAGVCLTSDVLALSSESDMKTQPLSTFGNTITHLWFLIHIAKLRKNE